MKTINNKKDFILTDWSTKTETIIPAISISESVDDTLQKVKKIIGQLEEKRVDITLIQKEWVNIGFAFANEFGDEGSSLFHRVSQFHPAYDLTECADQYSYCLNSKGTGITIGTFFYYAKEALKHAVNDTGYLGPDSLLNNKDINLEAVDDDINVPDEKYVYNCIEIFNSCQSTPDYLMEPIFPRIGSAVLAGKPDTGKSQFARQLCVQIANGKNDFIGMELNPIYHSALYVSTEDNLGASSFPLRQQHRGLNITASANLRFIFADTLDQSEILKSIHAELTLSPVDLVVVDSFGDIFTGADTNNNAAMRNTVKIFDRIANKYNCLVLFVHHVNKAAYKLAPSQEHIQGGAGLVQKVRIALMLSEGADDLKYLTVVKGNYCPKEFKQNARELEFSEENFLFTSIGNTLPVDQIVDSANNGTGKLSKDKLTRFATEALDSKCLPAVKFWEELKKVTGKSLSHVKRYHKKMITFGIIEKTEEGYSLKV